MLEGLCACETSEWGRTSLEGCADSVAGVNVDDQTLVLLGDGPVFPTEVGGKSQIFALSTVVVVGSLLVPLAACDMPPVTGVTGPDNSKSKRSTGFFAGIAASDAVFFVEGFEVFVSGVVGSLFSVEAPNMAQLLSFDCVVCGNSGLPPAAEWVAWDLELKSMDLSGLLFFCSDGFSSTEPLPPECETFSIKIYQRFSSSGNL